MDGLPSITKGYKEISERKIEHEKGHEKKSDMCSDLMTLHQSKPDFKEKYMTEMTLTNFGAGMETMATTLTGVLGNILKHSECQLRIHTEIDAAISAGKLSDPPSYDQTIQLSFLQAW